MFKCAFAVCRAFACFLAVSSVGMGCVSSFDSAPRSSRDGAPYRFPTFDASGTRTTQADSRGVTMTLIYAHSTLQLGDGCIVPLQDVGGAFVLGQRAGTCRVEDEPLTVVSLSGQVVSSRGHYQSFSVDFHAKDASGALVRYELRAGDCEGGRPDCQ